MMTTIIGIIGIFLGFSALVAIHELGHFIVAKAVGIRVTAFAIGYGPWYIFKKKWGDTEYRLGAIPFGGYVQMLGQDDLKVEADDAPPVDSFLAQPIWKRIAVVAAGAIFNFIFAIVLLIAVFFFGVTFPVGPYIGHSAPDAPISNAYTDLDANDNPVGEPFRVPKGTEILRVNDKRVKSFDDVGMTIAHVPPDSWVKLDYRETESGAEKTAFVKPNPMLKFGAPTIGPLEPDYDDIYFDIGARAERRVVVDWLGTNSEARAKGIDAGDMILSVRAATRDDIVRLEKDAAPDLSATGTATSQSSFFNPDMSDILGAISLAASVEPVFCPALSASVVKRTIDADIRTVADQSAGSGRVDLPNDIFDFSTLISGRQGAPVVVVVQSPGASATRDVLLRPRDDNNEDKTARRYLIGVSIDDRVHQITAIKSGSSADGHIRVGDSIVDINTFNGLTLSVSALGGFDLKASNTQSKKSNTPVRARARPTKTSRKFSYAVDKMTPADGKAQYDAGDAILRFQTPRPYTVELGLGESIVVSFKDTGTYMAYPFILIKRLLSPKSQIKGEAVSGPIGIGSLIYRIAGLRNPSYFIWWIAFLSIQLGVINLLPIPVVDGGHIAMFLYEAIRGKPLPLKVQEALLYAGLAFLGLVFLFATFKDITRFF